MNENAQAKLKELNQKMAETCQSEDDAVAFFQEALLPKGDELNESALDMVTGGMTNGQALRIFATAYWDAVRGRRSRFSNEEVYEAIRKVDKIADTVQGISVDIIKRFLEKYVLGF